MKKIALLITLAFIGINASNAQNRVEKWDVFELSLEGSKAGNPFVGLKFTARFSNGAKSYEPEGFYDGNGIYKLRFMPDAEGTWTYTTSSNRDDLNNKKGSFTCIAPGKNNHGPVQVRNTYHFGYADGTAFYPFGTTIYEWAFQTKAKQLQTIETLTQAPFNKARMLIVPPYSSRYLDGPEKMTVFPFVGTSKENFDFSRFNPEYFKKLEENIITLLKLGVEADLIIFRPYDKGRWGFDTMDHETNERFIRYVIARFSAYRNVWWSLANENSFIKHLGDEDWDRYFQVVQKFDPYNHLRSIHNADRIYDYNKPWVSHVSLQYYNAVRVFGVSALLRDIYKKPIVHDEINYEGNLTRRWGQLSGEELTYRFWQAYIGGAYATHGESTEGGWISTGGKLTGQSPSRIAFLKQIVQSGPKEGLTPIDHYYVLNAAGKAGEYYLYYFGKDTPKDWEFIIPDHELKNGMRFKADIIDTWNMIITPVEKVFEVKMLDNYKFTDIGNSKIALPGKPYIAIRIQKIEDSKKPEGRQPSKRRNAGEEEL